MPGKLLLLRPVDKGQSSTAPEHVGKESRHNADPDPDASMPGRTAGKGVLFVCIIPKIPGQS